MIIWDIIRVHQTLRKAKSKIFLNWRTARKVRTANRPNSPAQLNSPNMEQSKQQKFEKISYRANSQGPVHHAIISVLKIGILRFVSGVFNSWTRTTGGYIDVGDGYWIPNVLVKSLRCWWPIQYIEKIINILKKVANRMILPPTSQISHQHKVTNIMMSPTSLPVTVCHPTDTWNQRLF